MLQRSKTVGFALSLAMFTGGCAHVDVKQRAYTVGMASKVAVDESYEAWDKLANARDEECQKKLPPEDHTKSEYDACVGPFNENVQSKIVLVLQAVQSAQLVLFIALAEDKSDEEVRKALIALSANVQKFIFLVKESQ